MPAYLIADIEVLDTEGYEEYRRQAPATVTAYGGRYLARGGATAVLEGTWAPRRLVILEFPNLARAREWWNSPEYRAIRPLRERCARSSFVLTEGE
jgi:uncharacterized protein (DUF1330 family)